jgi:hypothetical protein
MGMNRLIAHGFATILLAAAPWPASAQQLPAGAIPAPSLSYADHADLVVRSPLVIDTMIRSATRIKGAEAADVAPGAMRFYVEADVLALVRGDAAIPARVGWVVDVPAPGGRAPKLKKRRVLAFARAVAGTPGQVQLVAPDAQRDWTPAADALVRRIAAELVAPDAPPVVTGVGNAFHVPGSLPGESETQIFLQTQGGRPAALSILRRPGEAPRWSVALSEIIDSSAAAPAPDTLLWYRLACALPAELPARATDQLAPADADAARADYAVVIAGLGPCRAGAAAPGNPGAPAGSW